MENIGELTREIADICPIKGLRRRDGVCEIVFEAHATDEQRAAAEAALAAALQRKSPQAGARQTIADYLQKPRADRRAADRDALLEAVAVLLK